MTSSQTAQSHAGQAVYSPLVLKGYDLWVLGLSNHLLWRCPTSKLRALYDRNVSANHLDVGVGTGYFLKHARWPTSNPSVALFDLNANSLHAASQRIAHLSPQTIVGDILQPLPDIGPFDSVGACYLLHCLPGAMSDKVVVFDHIHPVMASGARMFGATILQGGTERSWPAQKLMEFYNSRGIFSNAEDDADALKRGLESQFDLTGFEISGCVAMFEATKR